METGQVKIEKFYCIIDVGRAINPQQVMEQIQGGLVQSAGYAVLENFIEKERRVLPHNLSTYMISTVLDIPDEMDIMVLEIPDPRGHQGHPWAGCSNGYVAWRPPFPPRSMTRRVYGLIIFPLFLKRY